MVTVFDNSIIGMVIWYKKSVGEKRHPARNWSVYQKLSKATRKMTSGTWMRRDCFGEHYQIKVLVKNPSSAKVGKK